MQHLFLLFSCLLFAFAANGQSKKVYEYTGKDYALFFAVNTYEHMTDLENPIQNAIDIAKVLHDDYDFEVEVIENPTLLTIEEKLKEYEGNFANGIFDQEGQLLVFFSGHGSRQNRDGYFMPSDVDPNAVHRTGIHYGHIRFKIDGFACRHILVTVDACDSGTFDPNFGRSSRDFIRKNGNTENAVLSQHEKNRARLFITSDTQGKETPDNSNLARRFLFALRDHHSKLPFLTHDELMGTYLKIGTTPIPGGGEFGADDPPSRFLFFRNKIAVPSDTRADLNAWRIAEQSDNCEAYMKYLTNHPNGDFADHPKIQRCLEEGRMLKAWTAAKSAKDCDLLSDFVYDYPSSDYISLALSELSELNCDEGFVRVASVGIDSLNNAKDKLSDFNISRHQVTNEEFVSFLNDQDNAYQGGTQWYEWDSGKGGIMKTRGLDSAFVVRLGLEQHPVVEVSWYGAVAYCNWLSRKKKRQPYYRVEGRSVTPIPDADGFRLPTEMELGRYAKSPKGAKTDGMDEVSSWCWDEFADNPKSKKDAGTRVVRLVENNQLGYRGGLKPNKRDQNVGFRVVF